MPTLEFNTRDLIRISEKNIEIGAVLLGREKSNDQWVLYYVGEGDPKGWGYCFENLRRSQNWDGDKHHRLLYLTPCIGSVTIILVGSKEFDEHEFFEPPGRTAAPVRIFEFDKAGISFEAEFPPLEFPNGNKYYRQFNKREQEKLAAEGEDQDED
jgi:hypothetical protein